MIKDYQTLIGAVGLALTVICGTYIVSGDLGAIKSSLTHIGEQLDKLEDRFNDHIIDHNN